MQRGLSEPLPEEEDRRLAWFARKAFPSVASGISLNYGQLTADQHIRPFSEMREGGVAFADGIESDHLNYL